MTDRAEQRMSTTQPLLASTAEAKSSQPARLLQLREGTDLHIRAEHHLQFGTTPERAHVLSVPPTAMVDQLHQVMRELRRPMAESALIRILGHCGIPEVHARGIVAELVDSGFLLLHPSTITTRVHVLGPILYARALIRHLRQLNIPASGITPGTSAFGRLSSNELVVLAGGLFPPPDLSYHLMELGVPHLTCGIVDSRVAVGPIVLPGGTACLTCADTTYLASDAEWRTVRGQAMGLPAPVMDRSIELLATVTSEIVRDLMARYECSSDRKSWNIPQRLCERRYFDPLSFSVSRTIISHNPDCLSCAIAPTTTPWGSRR